MNPRTPTIMEVASEMALPKSTLDKIASQHGPEAARTCAMATSVGGIGPLMKDRLVGQKEQGFDVFGVSLLYDAVWVQNLKKSKDLSMHPVDNGDMLRQALQKTKLGFDLTLFDGETVHIDVYRCDMGKGTEGYYLSCPSLIGVVYPGPIDAPKGTEDPGYWAHVMRLKHNHVLGRGALHLAKKLNRSPDLVVLSETPTVFSHHRFFKDDLQNDSFFANTKYLFNDHTPLEYAHPLWDEHTCNLIQLDSDLYLTSPAWNKKTNHLDVTVFTVGQCEGTFGVAKKHGDVIKAMPSLKRYVDKIDYVTNGVRCADWQSESYAKASSQSEDDLLNTKDRLKVELLDWIETNGYAPKGWKEKHKNDPVALLTRRITPYKRLDILSTLLTDAKFKKSFLSLNIILVVGGRIHQEDRQAMDFAKDLLALINKDKGLSDKVIFLPNFNVWEAPLLYYGTDTTIMMSDDSQEASATGFMKALMNGSCVIGSPDGAVPEFVDFMEDQPNHYNGFKIPYKNGQPTIDGLHNAFVNFSKIYNDTAQRKKMIRASIEKTRGVDIARTVEDTKKIYTRILKSVTPA